MTPLASIPFWRIANIQKGSEFAAFVTPNGTIEFGGINAFSPGLIPPTVIIGKNNPFTISIPSGTINAANIVIFYSRKIFHEKKRKSFFAYHGKMEIY